jgi:hypothetical protein
MSVKTCHPNYISISSEWKKCRDAAAGERAIHEAREEYLPRLSLESDDSYSLRLSMTPFFNATWRTIAGLRGMLFRKPPTVEANDSILKELDNVDLAGTSMADLAQETVEEALTVGRVGLLVDYPQVENPSAITKADVIARGLRTTISLYKAESIINWKVAIRSGGKHLTMVVLKESETLLGKTEFDHAAEDRYRVLDLFNGVYRQRVFRVNEKEEDVLLSESFPLMNNQHMAFIPFVFIGVDKIGPEVDDPPLIDLINTNLKHYGQATSYERGCFFSGLPTMFISGHEPDKDNPIYIGGSVANALPNATAKAYYVEVTGNFSALRTNLEDKKREMAVLGARMLEEQKLGVEAAEAIARRQNGEESFLSAIAQTVSKGLTQTLNWFAMWQGVEGDNVYEINRDFVPAKMDAQTLTALVAAWQQGAFSKETLFDNLKQGEIISDSVTFEEEEARTEVSLVGLMSADPAQDKTVGQV